MKVLIDTNVILDVLCNRTEFVDASKNVWKLCEVCRVEGYISVLSIPNLVYIMRKELDAAKAREIIRQLSLIFGIADLTDSDILRALALGLDDFEDALQVSTAERIDASYIVTRNIKDYENSPIPAITPIDFLKNQ